MNADQYSNFKQLFAQEKRGIDYRIMVEDRGSDVLIMAPHGGKLDLSRFCSGHVLMLGGLAFEGHGAFPTQG
jgi:hypothetical protein